MKSTIEITDRGSSPVQVRSDSFNEAARTVEIIWSTGAQVKRFSWDEGEYMEELSMDPKHVRLGRLNAGASFLDTHEQYSMRSRLGAIVPGTARIEKGLGIATVQITRNPEGERLMVDLRDGMPLSISVGYKTYGYQREQGEDEGKLPVLRAIDWEPMEISAVPVPADPGAQARTEATHSRLVPIVTRGKAAAGSKEPEMSETNLTSRAVEMERARTSEISSIGIQHRADPKLIQKAIAEGQDVAAFRVMVMDANIAAYDKNPTYLTAPSFDGRADEPVTERMADALLGRLNPGHKVTVGRDFVGVSLGEMARFSLEQRGTSTRGLSTGQLIERSMHTTSDLPAMLDITANRIMRGAYAEQPSGLREAAKEQSALDFRTRFSIGLDLAGKLTKVNEHGEFKRLTITEGVEGYALATYGGVFAVTRQALINENLGYFAEMPEHFGKLAARLEAQQLTTLLLGTQKLADGAAVYHASHANLLTAAALSTASLAAARLAMRRQKGPAGEVINIAPKFLVVPPELELLGEQVLAQVNAEKISDVNVFANRLTLIVENNLTDGQGWYLLADQSASGLEYAYLEGEKGVQLMSRVGFDVDGMEWKARLDYGAGWIDFRGAVKNPGVAP